MKATNTDAVPLPCPMCNASLTDASASGYHYHPANDCVFSGFEVSCDDVAAWNRRHPDVPTADDGEIWPSATVIVDEQGNVTSANLYAPGLPAGRHDLFPVRVPYMEEHTEAWLAVSDALRAVDPDYLNGHGNAIEQAVVAIRRLAASVAPSAAAAQADHIADESKMASADGQIEAVRVITDAARDVLAERAQQISNEGWSTAHDDEHDEGEMASAAAAYAAHSCGWNDGVVRDLWPPQWSLSWLKPTTPRRDLVKAAALILAEIERIDRTASLQTTATSCERSTFQDRVQPWMIECFGPEIAVDKIERNHRFFEEATEAVQANGMTRSEAHQLVDYTFDRPVGELHQEIGGVMVTLAALCLASGQDMHAAGETELARIWTKVEAIRAKQAAKPKYSPLPAAPQLNEPNQRGTLAELVEFLRRKGKLLQMEHMRPPARMNGRVFAKWADELAAILAEQHEANAGLSQSTEQGEQK